MPRVLPSADGTAVYLLDRSEPVAAGSNRGVFVPIVHFPDTLLPDKRTHALDRIALVVDKILISKGQHVRVVLECESRADISHPTLNRYPVDIGSVRVPGRNDVSPVAYEMNYAYVPLEMGQNLGEEADMMRRLVTPAGGSTGNPVGKQKAVEPVDTHRDTPGGTVGAVLLLPLPEHTELITKTVEMRMRGKDRKQQRGPRATGARNDDRLAAETALFFPTAQVVDRPE